MNEKNNDRGAGKQPSFRERAEQMIESAHRLVAVSDDLLVVSDFLSEEAARMKAASERFAQKRQGEPKRPERGNTRDH